MRKGIICAHPDCTTPLTLAQLARGSRYCSLDCGRRCRATAQSIRAACARLGITRPTWIKASREGRAGWRYGRPWYVAGIVGRPKR